MSGYRHGVFTAEVPTGILPPVRVDSALPVVCGTAPVHTLEAGTEAPVNAPRLIFTRKQFISEFGSVPKDEKAHDYTLSEFADSYFGTYGVAPFVAVNVFDPARHTRPVQGGDGGLTAPDVSKVNAADIIGGIDGASLKRTGLEILAETFPRFSLIPGQVLAPGFSGDPSVALIMGAKCENINGHFKAGGIIDIPDEVANYTESVAWMKDNNLTDKNLTAFLGKPRVGSDVQWGSTHWAGVTARRDAANSGIPFWSPSNSRLLANGLVHAGKELVLGNEEAQFLNGNGIVTGLNFIGGMVAWGNRTAAYPGITDPKDSFIPVRRMFNWISNTLVLTAWQMLDSPVRRRMIESVVDTFNVWLNGLATREYILGGRVEFLAGENPTTDLMDGIIRFHVFVTPPSPAREIEFILEYDPNYFSTLFAA